MNKLFTWTTVAPGHMVLDGCIAEIKYEPRDENDARYFVAYVNGRKVHKTDCLMPAKMAAEHRILELIEIGLVDDPR